MNLLRKRGMTRWQAIRFGLKWRANEIGVFKAAAVTLSIVMADIVRQIVRSSLRFGLVFPLRLLAKAVTTVTNVLLPRSQTTTKKKLLYD